MTSIPLLPSGDNAEPPEWQPVNKSTLTEIMGLPEFEVTHVFAGEEMLHVKVKHREQVAMCPECQTLSVKIHQVKERTVQDLSIAGKRVVLNLLGRRFRCETCGGPFTERLRSIGHRRRQTRRYEQYVYEQCLVQNRKGVATQEGLSESTVKDIFVRHAEPTVQEQATHPVQVLGIDEIALKKRHKQYALVISDLSRHCVLTVLPERKKKALVAWLEALPDAVRQSIRVVSTDLWEPYRSAVHEALPQAQQVADRFHMMQQLNKRLTQARRALQKQADEETRQVLKGSRWLLLRARADLTPEDEEKLQAVLNASDELRTIYLLKEEFRLICDKARNRQQAARFLRAWVCKVQLTDNTRLLKFVKTLRNWWDEFLNYFVARVTQGFVEGINNAIRTLIRRAYGFRNFELFRLHVLAQHGGG